MVIVSPSIASTYFDLTQLTDVNTTGVTDGQVIKFNSTSSEWEPEDDTFGAGGGGYNQNLNTTDSPTFASLTLDGNLDMDHNDIVNAFEIECENDLSVGNDIQLNDRLEHTGDTDTFLDFGINQIILSAGGVSILDMIPTLSAFGVNVTISENLTIDYNVTSSGHFVGNGSGLDIDWDRIYDMPAGFADGVDNEGVGATYYADNTSLNLTGVVFSINGSIFKANLSWDGTYLNATDTNTQLSEGQVDTYVANNGYITNELDPWFNSSLAYLMTSTWTGNWNTSFEWGNHSNQNYLDLDTYPNTDTDSTDDFDGVWSSLTDVPSGFSDNIDNVDTNWNNLTNVPSGFSDNIDNTTSYNQDLNTTSEVTFSRLTGNGSGLWWLNWNNLFNLPAGFADGIDNTGGSPGGSSGQMQYNNSGDFDGAYYYKDGNMTSSLDGTWGYYEDDTLIVIGNLSYVSIYKD